MKFSGRIDVRLIDTQSGEILATAKDEEETADSSVKIAGGGSTGEGRHAPSHDFAHRSVLVDARYDSPGMRDGDHAPSPLLTPELREKMGACSVKSVTAQFNLKPVWIQGGGYYDQPANAYAAATDGSVIELQAATFASPILDQARSVTLKGGYDGTFTSNSGTTTLQGGLTIVKGTVVLDKILIL